MPDPAPHYAEAQLAICARFGVSPLPSPASLKVGIARNVRDDLWPVNGLRHEPEGDTTGWYIWAGEHLPTDPGFFVSLHASHLADWCPLVIPYLQLPPGWRFLLAPGHEDAWEDPTLLSR